MSSIIFNRPTSPSPKRPSTPSGVRTAEKDGPKIKKNQTKYLEDLKTISRLVQDLRKSQIAFLLSEKTEKEFISFTAKTLHEMNKLLKAQIPKTSENNQLRKEFKVLLKEDLKKLAKKGPLAALFKITDSLLLKSFPLPHQNEDVAHQELEILEKFRQLVGSDSLLNPKIQQWKKNQDSFNPLKLTKMSPDHFTKLLKLYDLQKRVHGALASLPKEWEIKFLMLNRDSSFIESLNHEISKPLKEELINDLQEILFFSTPELTKAQFKYLKEVMEAHQDFQHKILHELNISKEDFEKASLDEKLSAQLLTRLKGMMLFQSNYPWSDLKEKPFDYSSIHFEFVVSEKLLENKEYLQTLIGKEIEFHFLLSDKKNGIEYLNGIIQNIENTPPYLANLVKAWAHEISHHPSYFIHQQIIGVLEVLKKLGVELPYLKVLSSFKKKESLFFKTLSNLVQEGKKIASISKIVSELEFYLFLNQDPQEAKNLESTLKGLGAVEFIKNKIKKLSDSFIPEVKKLHTAFQTEKIERPGELKKIESKNQLVHSSSGSLENFSELKVMQNPLYFDPLLESTKVTSKVLDYLFFLIQLAAEHLDRKGTDSQNSLLLLLEDIRKHPSFSHHFASPSYLNLYSITRQYIQENFAPINFSEKYTLEEFLPTITEEANPWHAKLIMYVHTFSKSTNDLLKKLYDLKKSEMGQLNFLRFVFYYLQNDKISLPIPGTEDYGSVKTTLDLILKENYPNSPIYNELLEKIKEKVDLLFPKNPKIPSAFEDVLKNNSLDKINSKDPFKDPLLQKVVQNIGKMEAEIDSLQVTLKNLDGTVGGLKRGIELRGEDNLSKILKVNESIDAHRNRLNDLKMTLDRYKNALTVFKRGTLSYIGEIQFRLFKYLFRIEQNMDLIDRVLANYTEILKKSKNPSEITSLTSKKEKLGNKARFMKWAFDALRAFIYKPSLTKEKPKTTMQDLGPYVHYFIEKLKDEDFDILTTIKVDGVFEIEAKEDHITLRKIHDDLDEYYQLHLAEFKSKLKPHSLDHINDLNEDILEEKLNAYLSEPLSQFSLAEFNKFSFEDREINFKTSPTFIKIHRRFELLRTKFIPYTLVVSQQHKKTADILLILAEIALRKGHFDLYYTIALSLDENISEIEKKNKKLKLFLEDVHEAMTKKNKILYRNALELAIKNNGTKPTYPILSIIAFDIAINASKNLIDEETKQLNFPVLKELEEIKDLYWNHAIRPSAKLETDLEGYIETCALNFPSGDDAKKIVKQKYETTEYHVTTEGLAEAVGSIF